MVVKPGQSTDFPGDPWGEKSILLAPNSVISNWKDFRVGRGTCFCFVVFQKKFPQVTVIISLGITGLEANMWMHCPTQHKGVSTQLILLH